MSSQTAEHSVDSTTRPNLDRKTGALTNLVFILILLIGLIFTAINVWGDIDSSRVGEVSSWTPFLLLGIALVIALGFEFVNGFHDTANAVATVIYTHSLPPHFAVLWSGCFNFLGVLFSSGAVASGLFPCCRSNSSFKWAPSPASPWCLLS